MPRLLHSSLYLSSRRLFSTTTIRTIFATGPAPPRLPPKEQEEFERLQRSSTSAFSTPRPLVTVNQPASSTGTSTQSRVQKDQSLGSKQKTTMQINQSPPSQSEKDASPVSAEEIEIAAVNTRVGATGNGEELHPDVRRGQKPEFEGDVNPVTGEVGGPKNEPLRWGSTGVTGDWSYNGRVTDF